MMTDDGDNHKFSMHLYNLLYHFKAGRVPVSWKQLQAKPIKQAACVKCVQHQVCYYSGDDEKNITIFMLQLNFPAQEDCFYDHPLINWAPHTARAEWKKHADGQKWDPVWHLIPSPGENSSIKTVPSHKRSDLILLLLLLCTSYLSSPSMSSV